MSKRSRKPLQPQRNKYVNLPEKLVDIVIPVFGRFDLLQSFLDALPEAAKGILYNVILVDNKSPIKEDADKFLEYYLSVLPRAYTQQFELTDYTINYCSDNIINPCATSDTIRILNDTRALNTNKQLRYIATKEFKCFKGRERDKAMSKARRDLDWEKQFNLALYPEDARAIRASRTPEDEATCTMCGDFCASRGAGKLFAGDLHDHKR